MYVSVPVAVVTLARRLKMSHVCVRPGAAVMEPFAS
jgi:hypothetical protein